jgi:nitrite reductase/ring-hydroxylating ferredoxin subunit
LVSAKQQKGSYTTMTQMNRRELMVAAAATACACCLGDPLQALAGAPATPAPPEPIDAGPLSDYSKDGVTNKWMASPTNVVVIRHQGKLYASTTVCTHRGGILKVDAASGGVFACPRHHAGFDINGLVTKGPAKTPLNRFKISVNSGGHVIVDRTKTFAEDKWNDPSSFVAVK